MDPCLVLHTIGVFHNKSVPFIVREVKGKCSGKER